MTGTGKGTIGPVLATFLVANNMIGSGYFLLPASLANSGSLTILSWLLGTVLALVLGAGFARLARHYPHMQCADDYARPALGRDVGFLSTTLYWIASWIGNNAIAVAAFGYLLALLPFAADQPATHLVGQLALIWLVFALNLLGPRQVARFQSLSVVFGLLPVLVVLGWGWHQFDAGTFSASWNTTGADWNTVNPEPRGDVAESLRMLAPIFWAFVGLETGAMVAGVVRNPARNVPLATLAGIGLASVVYIASSILVMGIVPARELAASSAPYALVAGRLLGDWAMLAIAAAAALKATGTLAGWMLVSGESGARAAQRRLLPAWFGRQQGNGAATPGLLFVALSMSAITVLTASATAGEQFGRIIGMVVLLIVLAYVAAGFSLLRGSPGRRPELSDRLLGIGALAACALLLFTSPWRTLAGAVAIAGGVWLLYRWHRRGAAAALPAAPPPATTSAD
jgi:arginine:agmatine antiporter